MSPLTSPDERELRSRVRRVHSCASDRTLHNLRNKVSCLPYELLSIYETEGRVFVCRDDKGISSTLVLLLLKVDSAINFLNGQYYTRCL